MLFNKLRKYTNSGMYPFHMPGHKRNPGFLPDFSLCDLDITEIHGFDDLHDPQGVLLETSKLAAGLYGSREAFMLVGGSTAGILAAVGAHARRGGKVLADSNCHRSVPNAAELFGLELVFVTPGADEASGVPCSVMPSAVEAALRGDPDIGIVVITSPSYEGVVSDISAIADIVHEAGALLLVDCAHGAHLGFSKYLDGNVHGVGIYGTEGIEFPGSPVSLGADAVVMSLHKTLPALTQCSLLHVCSDRADTSAVKRMLGMLQTSSPSYVLMSSIDYCLRLLASDADRLFCEYGGNLAYFYDCVRGLRNLSVLGKRPGFFGFDPGKIVIVTKNAPMGGMGLSDILREKYKLEIERSCAGYAIAMTSICDTREGFTRLADALLEVDGLL